MTQMAKPHVLLHPTKRIPETAPRSQAAGGPDGGPYIQRGSTQNFVVAYEQSLGADGQTFADAVLAVCERDYTQLQSVFGNISVNGLPFQVYLRLGDSNNGGAYHYSCVATALYCFVTPGEPTELANMLVVAEEDEVFMGNQSGGWNCGYSNGEGLSRILSTELHPSALNGFASAAAWLDSNRQDWVDTTEQTDRDYVSIGCATLFLNYLHYQLGRNWSDIIQKGGATLAQTYSNLTGRSDAFSSFATLLQARFPQGTPSGLQNDNPFPMG
jgi:hypothetical protein